MDTGKFVVIDIEKSNNKHNSICQIGLLVIENGVCVERFDTLVNPQAKFQQFHINIHGIKPEDVLNAPTMQQLHSKLAGFFDGAVVCSYGLSDKLALGCYFDVSVMTWLDISRVVKNSIPEFRNGGHKLSVVARTIGLNVNNDMLHNALADATLAYEVLCHCVDVHKVHLKGYINKPNLSLF